MNYDEQIKELQSILAERERMTERVHDGIVAGIKMLERLQKESNIK